MNKKRFFGILLVIISLIISFSNLTITGAVIGSAYIDFLSFFSIFIFIGGIILIYLSKRDEGGLEKNLDGTVIIVEDSKFKKRIKNYDRKSIKKALAKIGTGLGDEHPLSYNMKKCHVVHESKGGVIVFQYKTEEGAKYAIILDYLPQHELIKYKDKHVRKGVRV